MTGLVLTDDVVLPERNVVLEEQQPARRQQSAAPCWASRCRPRCILNHPVRPAGDRLAARDREARPRGRARFLSPLLHAQQRHPGGRRRRQRRRGAASSPKRPTARCAKRAEIGPRVRPQEPEQVAPRTVTLADPRVAQPSLQRYYLVPSDATGRARRSRSARGAVAHSRQRRRQPALPEARGREAASPSAPAPGTTARRSTRPALASTARRSPGVTLPRARRRDRRGARRGRRQGRHRGRTRARQDRLIADDGLCAGQPGVAGALVRRGARRPARPSSRSGRGRIACAP